MNETATARKPREKLAEPVKIRFRLDVLDELMQCAEDRGSTINEVVRRFVDAGFDNELVSRWVVEADKPGMKQLEKQLERITSLARRGDWDGLREYVERLNLEPDDADAE